jgi:hypothetical protein
MELAVVRFALEDGMPPGGQRDMIVTTANCKESFIMPSDDRPSKYPNRPQQDTTKYTVQYTRLPDVALASRALHAEVLWLMRNARIGPLFLVFKPHPHLYVPWNPSTSSLTPRIEHSWSLIQHILDCNSVLAPEIHGCCRSLIIECSREESCLLVGG